MIANLIDSHGGLHNRITHEMYLAPFTLRETELMLQAYGFSWTRISILQIYSILVVCLIISVCWIKSKVWKGMSTDCFSHPTLN